MMRRLLFVATLVTSLAPAVVSAQNTSSANAFSLAVGGSPVEAIVAPGTDRWYTTRVQPGKSYCAETQGGVEFDASVTAGAIDTTVTIYQSDAATVVLSNDDVVGAEPAGNKLSRACFRSTLGVDAIIYVKVSSNVGTFNTRMRFVETTRYSDWFFVGSDYHAFTLVRNTTNVTLSYTIDWRDLSGALAGTVSGTLAPNGGTVINARGNLTLLPATISGTVTVSHNGPESAVVASTTVMSTTTGLSFDAPFETRRPW
jgi:hypothetical protein